MGIKSAKHMNIRNCPPDKNMVFGQKAHIFEPYIIHNYEQSHIFEY